MAEVLTRSQSPITHQVFWNGEISSADAAPTVKIYDITSDATLNPLINPTTIISTITSLADENNPGTYIVNIPYALTDRNKTLRLVWEYSVGGTSVVRADEVYVVTPYVNLTNVQDLGFSTDPTDPQYKSYKDLVRAEKYARKQIEEYTGQEFYLKDDTYVVYGYGSDILPLPKKINSIQKLYVKDILLLDNINNINNWNYTVMISESGYGIRVDRTGMLDNTVYIANGMVPPSINDGEGIFHSHTPYKIQARFGWSNVPEAVEMAGIELMKDYFAKDLLWRNKYVKKISTFDWDFEYSGSVFMGTGNAYADKLLADYVLDSRIEII
jgi:hypothetical protein